MSAIERGALVHGSDSPEFDLKVRFCFGHYLETVRLEDSTVLYRVGWIRDEEETQDFGLYRNIRPITREQFKELHGAWRDIRDERIMKRAGHIPPPEPPIGDQIRAFLRSQVQR